MKLLIIFLLLCFNPIDLSAKSLKNTSHVQNHSKKVKKLNSQDLTITQERIQHIADRHLNKNKHLDATKFSPHLNEEKVVKMIRRTVANPRTQWQTTNEKYTAEYTYKKPIGVDKNGHEAKLLRVVIAPNGYLITAHPVAK